MLRCAPFDERFTPEVRVTQSFTFRLAVSLALCAASTIDAQQATDTLHILLKYQSDISKAAKELAVNGA